MAPHPAVETAYLPPEAVLYDERTGKVFRLNPSASAVWVLLGESGDVDAIAAEISEIFEVPVGEVRADVAVAIEQFAAQGLLGTEEQDHEGHAGPSIEVPDDVRRLVTDPPRNGEVAARLRVFTRGGRAVVVDLAEPEALDPVRLAQAGVVEVPSHWCFVTPDGTAVSVNDLRWPLAGALVSEVSPADLDEARRRLWPLGRGDRESWERLVGTDGWVVATDGDVNEALEALLT